MFALLVARCTGGPSDSDPKGIEGLQDCELDRYNLCAAAEAKAMGSPSLGWDYLACTYRNQKETDTITDGGKRFDATVSFCAVTAGLDPVALKGCAYGTQGAGLAVESLKLEKASNPNVDSKGHGHPTWVVIDGAAANTDPDTWLKVICAAIPKGTPKPAAC